MNTYKGIITAMLAALVFSELVACEREGPAEKAGKAIDDAASNVADETKDTMETIEKKMDK